MYTLFPDGHARFSYRPRPNQAKHETLLSIKVLNPGHYKASKIRLVHTIYSLWEDGEWSSVRM